MSMQELDEKIIMKHNPAVRIRARMELEICHQIIKDARAAEYALAVDDEESGVTKSLTNEEVLELLFDLDEGYLILQKDRKNVGWVRLVFGNDGWDVINDYTVNIEDVLTNANKLADKYGGE